MDGFDKFFEKYSYKFLKGYPDWNNKQDVLLFNTILKEDLNIDIVSEATTTATEDLHEIFTAMFLAGMKNYTKEEFIGLEKDEWAALTTSLGLLENPKEHSDLIDKYLSKTNPFKPLDDKTINKYYDLFLDAKSTANELNNKLYSGGGLESVGRVFGAGVDGKKLKGDIYVKQNVPGVKADLVDVSLKYGKGQFNSLSATKVLAALYDIPEGDLKGEGNGLLGQLYDKKSEYKNAIDKGVRDYLNFVLKYYKEIPEGKINPEFVSILDDFNKSGNAKNITWPEWRKTNKEIKTAFRKALAAPPLTSLKGEAGEFEDSKRLAVNRTIEDFLKDYKVNEVQEDIQDLLIYILGASDTSYFYAAEGGGKAFFIPSIKRIKSREYILDTQVGLLKGGEESANYVVDVTVKDKETGEPLFLFDVYLRFSGVDGQYTSDIAQKGAKFKVMDSWNKIYFNS